MHEAQHTKNDALLAILNSLRAAPLLFSFPLLMAKICRFSPCQSHYWLHKWGVLPALTESVALRRKIEYF
jgi:hypothetical protein